MDEAHTQLGIFPATPGFIYVLPGPLTHNIWGLFNVTAHMLDS